MTRTIRYPQAETTSEKQEWSILAQALSLQESGILVQGMSVTDLSTGYCVEGPPEAMSPEYLQLQEDATPGRHSIGEDVALWGTNISVARLGELLVLLEEVVQQRRENPEAASVNPAVPRETFPWGIGLETPDILVAGAHAKIVAAYLRVIGHRARVVREDSALQLAAELTALPSAKGASNEDSTGSKETSAKNYGNAVVEATGVDRNFTATSNIVRDTSSPILGTNHDEETGSGIECEQLTGASSHEEDDHSGKDSGILKTMIAVALIVVVAGVGVVVASAIVARKNPGDRNDADIVASAQEKAAEEKGSTDQTETSLSTPRADKLQPEGNGKGDSSAPGQGKTNSEFRDPQKMGGGRETGAPRADVPTSVGVPGWNRIGATRGREEYRSDDRGMRVLIAAKPSPLRRQGDLDQAVLKALQKAKGVKVVQQSPVVYEERYPESVTRWHVMLRDGHQVSVGCQFRERNAQRDEQCEKVRDAAKPE